MTTKFDKDINVENEKKTIQIVYDGFNIYLVDTKLIDEEIPNRTFFGAKFSEGFFGSAYWAYSDNSAENLIMNRVIFEDIISVIDYIGFRVEKYLNERDDGG